LPFLNRSHRGCILFHPHRLRMAIMKYISR
jgi:hypothetical protein